jgi:hypothetical protein
MNKEIDDYVDRWFATLRGEPLTTNLILHPHIQNWFAAQRGKTIVPPEEDDLILYTHRRIKELNDKKT